MRLFSHINRITIVPSLVRDILSTALFLNCLKISGVCCQTGLTWKILSVAMKMLKVIKLPEIFFHWPSSIIPFSSNHQVASSSSCLLYTSDAADEEDSVDLGGRR